MTSMWGAPLRSRWRGARRHDPDQARFLTRASLRWVFANKAYTPWYLVRYYRLAKFKAANPHVVLRGMVFLGKRVEIHATPGTLAPRDRPLGAYRRRQRDPLPRGVAADRRQGGVREGQRRQHLPRHRDRRCPRSSRTGATSATSTTGWTTSTRPDQGPGHPEGDRCGSGRTRWVGDEGDRAARHADRARVCARRRTRW